MSKGIIKVDIKDGRDIKKKLYKCQANLTVLRHILTFFMKGESPTWFHKSSF